MFKFPYASAFGADRLENKSPFCYQPGEQQVLSALSYREEFHDLLDCVSPTCGRPHGYPSAGYFPFSHVLYLRRSFDLAFFPFGIISHSL